MAVLPKYKKKSEANGTRTLPSISLNMLYAKWVLLCAVLTLSGCITAFQRPATLPDTDKLEEGDIVLTFSGAPLSWMIVLGSTSNMGEIAHPYSHGEMLFRNESGIWMLGGVSDGKVQARPFRKTLNDLQNIAVYRASLPPSERRHAASVLKEFLADDQIRSASFDYSMQDIPDRRDKFFCVGIVNEAYRVAGLPPPFLFTPWSENNLGRHLEEILEIRFKTFTTAGSILSNPLYHKILSWTNDNFDTKLADMNKQIVLTIMDWYDQGWRIRSSNSFHIRQVVINLPDRLEHAAQVVSRIKLFVNNVFDTWHRMERRGLLEGLSSEKKIQLLQTICKKYRDRYFEHMDFAATSHARLQSPQQSTGSKH